MFISVPSKKIQEVDLRAPLLRYIKSTYSDDILLNSNKSVDELQSLRDSIVTKISEKNESVLELLERYHDSLVSLQSRVPILESGAIIEFKWYDAFSEKSVFNRNNMMKSNSGTFELLCVLYCIASIHSSIAASQPMNSDSCLQKAAKSYQLAAAIFDRIRHTVPMITKAEPTLDLKQETLLLLTDIMLAQAQEVIFTKAKSGDNVNNAMVAKVASQCVNLYDNCYKLNNCNYLKGKLPKNWSTTLGYKKTYFEIMMNLYQAKACEDAQNFGENITRYKVAYGLAKSLVNEYKGIKSLCEALKNMIERAEKDNRCIYHAIVPEPHDLQAVPPTAIAKIIPIPYPFSGEKFNDPFLSIVPMEVQMSIDNAQKILNEMIQDDIKRLKQATQTCNSTMQSLNLTNLTQNQGEIIPKNILDGAKDIREKDGFNYLKSQASSLPEAHRRNIEILNSIRAAVNDEANTDENLRKQYGAKWIRKQSNQLNGVWTNEIEKYDKMFEKTVITDAKVLENFEKHSEFLEFLSLTEAQLIELVTSTDVSTDSNTTQLMAPSQLKENLKNLVSQLETMKSDRQDLISQIQAIKIPESIREKYMNRYQSSGIVDDKNGEIAREDINSSLEGPRGCIRESLERQKELLADIQIKSSEFLGKNGVITDARSTLLTNLVLACEEYTPLIKDFNDGMKFYAEATNVLLKIQLKVDDFVFARKTEKEELMNDINIDISKATIDLIKNPHEISSTSGNPPERPPPPFMPSAPPTYTSQEQTCSTTNTQNPNVPPMPYPNIMNPTLPYYYPPNYYGYGAQQFPPGFNGSQTGYLPPPLPMPYLPYGQYPVVPGSAYQNPSGAPNAGYPMPPS